MGAPRQPFVPGLGADRLNWGSGFKFRVQGLGADITV